jgi:hypothetical protein
MNLRLKPVVISMVTASVLLFGSWFSFQYWGVTQPIEDQVGNIDGVRLVKQEKTDAQLILHVEVQPDVRLREVKAQLEKDMAELLAGRSLVLQVQDRSSDELERWWGEHLFQVAESMDLRQYAAIPEHLQQITNDINDSKVIVEMDETNVYVQLYEGDHYKFIILPRESRMGVWNG